MTIRRLLGEPVIQFLVIGAGAVAAYLYAGPPGGGDQFQVTVPATRIESLVANFEAIRRRPPTEQEREQLVRDFMTEEVFYREALRLGLDRDDLVVRRRMQQKMELMFSDLATLDPPEDAELEQFYQENSDRYETPAQFDFRQVFLGEGSEQQAPPGWRQLLETLTVSGDLPPEGIGDQSLLPPEIVDTSGPQIDRIFGDGFAHELAGVRVGAWAGPVRSAYGWHHVLVSARAPARLLPLADVRDQVLRDFNVQRSRTARAEMSRALLEKYNIRIEETGAGVSR